MAAALVIASRLTPPTMNGIGMFLKLKTPKPTFRPSLNFAAATISDRVSDSTKLGWVECAMHVFDHGDKIKDRQTCRALDIFCIWWQLAALEQD